MSTMHQTVETYLAAWSQPDETKRKALIAACFDSAGTYTDYYAKARNADKLSDLIGGCQQLFPGSVLVLHGEVLSHTGGLHFDWHMKTADGQLMLHGEDFAELNEQGAIKRIEAFFPIQGLEPYGDMAKTIGCQP